MRVAVTAVACLGLLAGCRGGLLQRGPQIAEVFDATFEFAGNQTFATVELERVIVRELGGGDPVLTRARTDDAAWVLEQHYARAGFTLVAVDYTFDPGDPPAAAPLARFEIQEGPRTQLGEVTFAGRVSLSARELEAALGLEDRREVWFSRTLVNDLANDVAGAYYARGFLEVAVGEPEVTFSSDRTRALVRIPISEGPRYVLTEVRFRGSESRSESKLRELIALSIGEPYTTRVAYELRARLVQELFDAGRRDVEIQFAESRDRETGGVTLLFDIDEGPAIEIGRILVEPEADVRSGFVQSRLELEPGDLWTAAAERKSFKNLYRSGLFRSIDLRLAAAEPDAPPQEETPEEEAPESDGVESQQREPEDQDPGAGRSESLVEVRDLIVELEELPTLEVYVEPGWGSYELARLRAGVAERNLFGTGRGVSIDMIAAIRAQRLLLSLTDPWFLGSDYAMTYTIFANRREEPAFTSSSLGAGATLARRWNDRWSSSLAYQFRFSDIDDVAPDFVGPADSDSSFDISSFTLTTTRDTRNGLFLPTRGSFARSGLEWAGETIGSELDFFRATFLGSSFRSLRDGTVLGVAARGGWIAPLGATDDIPLQERFFNGGENTVRSFLEDELGPLDANGDPIGGDAYTAFTVELRQRLGKNFETAAFVDAGNLTESHEDFLEFADYRFGIGTGLRYLLPIGPLRLDAAWNPDPGPQDSDWALHFAVGLSF